jgi:hypothetical protein
MFIEILANMTQVSDVAPGRLVCMMGIQVYSNGGPNPLQRGDNHKSAKIG